MTTVGGRPYAGTGLSLAELHQMPRETRQATLAGSIDVLRELLKEKRLQLLEAEGMLRDELLERGATVAVAGDWQVKLQEKRGYDYDLEGLTRLQSFLAPEDYERAVVEVRTVKVNKTQLNALAKRGGDIARIIGEATTPVHEGYTLEVEKRKR